MFIIETAKNENADSKYFCQWLNENYPLNKGFTIGSTLKVYFESEQTVESVSEIENKYASLTDQDVLSKENIKSEYQRYQIDGNAFYEDYMADLMLEFKTGNRPIDSVYRIEDKLELVSSKLVHGHWMTAREKMDTVTVDADLTQDRYDTIYNGIDSYININYT